MYNGYVPAWWPDWAHPRSPLVAISVRKGNIWDIRIAAYTRVVVRIISSFYAILLIYLPVTVVIIAAGRNFLSLLLFIMLVTVGPVLLITSEVLYIRLWFTLPARTCDLIAGEVERQTWDILLSTPIARRQIVLSKMAALYWANQPSVVYIFATRLVFLVGVFGRRALEVNSTFSAPTLAGIGWFLAIVLMPFAEMLALGSLGLLISALSGSLRQSLLVSLITQFAHRLLTITLFLVIFVDLPAYLILPATLFPHWVLIPLWRDVTYGSSLVWGLILIGVLWPLIVGLVSIWATLWVVSEAR